MNLLHLFKKRAVAVLFFSSFLIFSNTVLFDEGATNFPSVFHSVLDNGLELFVVENSAAPLADIHIAARCGAVSQSSSNAGLFHLYEHMLFKGNSKYENEAACTKAQNKMGAVDSNAYTSVDIVNYYFTVPSSQVKNGLEFWSLAVRTPKFDEKELKNEIEVVLSEINGNFSNPAYIRYRGLIKQLFPECPWALDAAGNPDVVKNATPQQMFSIQGEYYVPENSAVFVGGDVHHEEIYEAVKEIFGDWKRSKTPLKKIVPPSKNPFPSIKKCVFVDPGASDGLIQAGFYLRGPDGETDSADTYAADVWTSLCQNPESLFTKSLIAEKSLSIPASDYSAAYYNTARASGLIGMNVAMLNSDSSSPVKKSEAFLNLLQKKIIPAMTDKNQFFNDDSIKSVIRQLADARIYQLETSSDVLSELISSWSTCGSDYFFTYDDKIAGVTEDDVVSFVRKYILNKSGILIVSVSPNLWEKYSQEFKNAGFFQITSENNSWY